MIAQELLPLIDPKLHPRYSPNLHAWIRKHWKNSGLSLKVTTKIDERNLYVVVSYEDGWASGASLNALLGNGTSERIWAFGPNFPGFESGFDETFWARYIRDGRCAIDEHHQTDFVGDHTRWKVSGGVRECQWCGHHVQVKLDWTETVVTPHFAWVPA
jgi:hypothetical protein